MTEYNCQFIIKGPIHQHDCDQCTYLGTFTDNLSKLPYDYYFCKYANSKSTGSCVVRYGGEYWQYESIPVRSLTDWYTRVDNEKDTDAVSTVPLYYCYRLAKERGLILEDQ
jgi:hypothetical protein